MIRPSRLSGAFFIWLLAMSVAPLAAAQEGRWLRAETPHFVIYSDGREQALRETARTLERFDTMLRRLVPPGREAAGKLEVYLLRGRDSLRAVAPDLPADTAGFYVAGPEIVAAFAVFRSVSGLERQEILFHEYAHHYMLHYFTQAYPPWFVEGFAEMVSTADFRDDGAIVGRYSDNRAAWLVAGGWLDIDRFLASHRLQLSRDETAQFYAQSWLATHYLMLNPGQEEPLRTYLAAFQQGADSLEAFEPAFGMTPSEFNRRLRAYARSNLPLYLVSAPPTATDEPQITRLSAGADRLLLLDARMRVGESEALSDEEWLRIEQWAGEYPADPYAQRVFARAAIMRGAYQQARALLEPLASADSRDAEAHYLLGLSYIAEAANAPINQCAEIARQSRRHFARAFQLNDTHVATQYRYASSWQCDAEMPDTARDVLLNAYALAPQVSEITVNAALALMHGGQFEAAAGMLRPIAYSPHHREADDEIMELLAAAERGELPSGAAGQMFKD